MKNTLKTFVFFIALAVLFHFGILFILSDRQIFPCPVWFSINDQPSEWVTKKCDVNYTYDNGFPASKLNPGAVAARTGLIYFLPILITAGLIYALKKRSEKVL